MQGKIGSGDRRDAAICAEHRHFVVCCCDALQFQTIDTLVLPEKIMVAHAMPSLFVRT